MPYRRPAWLAAAALCAACARPAAGTPPARASAGAASAPSSAVALSPTSSAVSAPPSAAPAPPPPPPGVSVAAGWSVQLLGPGLGGPDDLLAGPGGGLYFSDIVAGDVGLLRPGAGAPDVVARGLSVPEGLAALPDGTLLVVEQGRNRIVRVQPQGGTVTPWLVLSNPTRLEGADGITLGADGLLIPDSPVGRVLLQAVAGDVPSGSPQVVAQGLTRPTSALRAPDGTVYVADETGGALVALAPGAAPRRVAALPEPDDVAAGPGTRLLVGCLDGTVREVDPATGAVAIVASGLGSPQGLAAFGSAWAVSDETGNRLYRLDAG